MAKKRPKVNLSRPVRPQTGDLEKLFTSQDDVEQAAGLQLVAIRLDAIYPDPSQPRRTFPEDSLEELAESIRQDGVIQPIEVTQMGQEQYMIVHGERRWRAAQMAGLETIPAIVRRQNYDEVTRFVRQLVENIQREDLNDVDRAAGLLRLRDLMQAELDAARAEQVETDEPWGSKITWAKVAKRLGYSRQRIHQLINLLDLPEEIKKAVREGSLSERDTRIYQGLKPAQQKALHEARMAGDLTGEEVKQVARLLKDAPNLTVYQAARLLRQPPEPVSPAPSRPTPQGRQSEQANGPDVGDESEVAVPTESRVVPARSGAPTAIDRLTWVRGHLARIPRHGLTAAERQEVLRLLHLIEQDVRSLLEALGD